jgi:excisionase family DNA binding protein
MMTGYGKFAQGVASEVAADRDTALLDVNQVAALLSCSVRHVYRLSDAGRMPRPRKLGALCRWSRREILDWIADGCQPARKAVRRC